MASNGDSKTPVDETEHTSGTDHVAKSVVPPSSCKSKIVTKYWTKVLARELLAEFIGTFMLVQFGTGAVMSAVFGGALLGLFQIASVWFIGVTLAICCTASISGAHLNPSISLAFALLRPCSKFGWNKVIPYVIAQLAGAVFASWINLLMYYSKIEVFEQTNNIT
jgi:glycerol uptake facilitator-like aquaporin